MCATLEEDSILSQSLMNISKEISPALHNFLEINLHTAHLRVVCFQKKKN